VGTAEYSAGIIRAGSVVGAVCRFGLALACRLDTVGIGAGVKVRADLRRTHTASEGPANVGNCAWIPIVAGKPLPSQKIGATHVRYADVHGAWVPVVALSMVEFSNTTVRQAVIIHCADVSVVAWRSVQSRRADLGNRIARFVGAFILVLATVVSNALPLFVAVVSL